MFWGVQRPIFKGELFVLGRVPSSKFKMELMEVENLLGGSSHLVASNYGFISPLTWVVGPLPTGLNGGYEVLTNWDGPPSISSLTRWCKNPFGSMVTQYFWHEMAEETCQE